MSLGSCRQVVSINEYQFRITKYNFVTSKNFCRSVGIFHCARHERKTIGGAFVKVFLSALVIWMCCDLCFNNGLIT